MSYDLYWFGDTWLVEAYWKAHKLRQKQINEQAWLNGIYESMAISSTIGNAFLDKGAQPFRYPEEPLDLDEKDKKAEPINETAYAMAYMNNMVRAGKNWGGKRK